MKVKQSIVDYGSKNMQDLRTARTATEFRRILGSISSCVTNVESVSKTLDLRVGESVSNSIELSDLGTGKPKRAATKKVMLADTIDLDTIDITNVAEKAKHNEKVRILNQAIAELNVAYQILSSRTFSAFKGQAEAASNLATVIKDAQIVLRKYTTLMSQDVKKGAPDAHKSLAASVANYLPSILSKEQYTKIRTRTYIARGTNPVTWQTFIHIDNFTNNDGVDYPSYCIVLSSEVNLTDGTINNYLTSLVDAQIPGTFPLGRKLESIASLKKAINNYMAFDGFLNYASRKPINKDTSTLRATTGLGNKTHNIRGRDMEIIDGMRVQNDKLYVRLVRGLTPEERKVAVNEVVAMASVVLRAGKNSRTSITNRVTRGSKGREWVELVLNNSSGIQEGVFTLAKVNELGSQFKLDASQLRALKQSIK